MRTGKGTNRFTAEVKNLQLIQSNTEDWKA